MDINGPIWNKIPSYLNAVTVLICPPPQLYRLYPGLDHGQATADGGLGEHTDSDICYNWVRDWHKIHLSRNACDHNM